MTAPSPQPMPSPARTSQRSAPLHCGWVALLGAALVAGCGGGASEPAPSDAQAVALSAVSAPGELTAYVQRLLRERAAERAQGSTGAFLGDSTTATVQPVAAAAATPARSGTLTQESGVDEPDLLKSDGTQLYALDLGAPGAPRLRAWRRAGDGSLAPLADVALATDGASSVDAAGMVLARDERSLVAISQRWLPLGTGDPCADVCPPGLLVPTPLWLRSSVALERFDLSDPSRPTSTSRIEFDGRIVAGRRIGDTLIVVSTSSPLLAADQIAAGTPAAEREAAIARTRGIDALPRLRVAGGAPQPLLAETDCWVQPANASLALEITTITRVDLRSATLAPASRCFVGGTEALYMTASALYLASTRQAYSFLGVLRYPGQIATDIHKFTLAADALAYRGSGSVPGHLGWDPERKSYRLSEHEGHLRVLSFTGSVGWLMLADAASTAPSPATLSVLREAGGSLEVLATLPNARRPQALGKPGEQVHGVRFAGNRGYVVTFRQIDPLFVLDLADPADPRIAGELEAPGFSDHLLPLSPGLLLGVGRQVEASGRLGGVKVALFDVSDPAQPREKASLAFGASGSSSALDHSRHGIDILLEGQQARIGLPLALFDADYANPRTGLQRLTVDLAAGTLAAAPLLGASGAPADADIARQRSIQIGAQTYHLRAGRLSGYDW